MFKTAMSQPNNSQTVNENVLPERILSSGIQLRTSARVLKKQKLDLEASLAAAESKKEEKAESEVSSSSSQSHPVVSLPEKHEKPERAVPPVKRARGIVPIWSPEDKKAFFEALNDSGKDIDGIEKIMRSKARKRPGDLNTPWVTCKSRLQIKSFYHRTLMKICKHVQLPDTVKKSTQELYILINYGELRKRIGLINERNAVKLKELIYCGSTQVRIKGKTWRVKTPVCRALKRLNKLEDNMDDFRLPIKVEILLTPRENRDRRKVENIGYNARIKTTLSVETPLSNVITFLQTRWATDKEVNDEQALKNNLQDKIPDPGGGVSASGKSNACVSSCVSVKSSSNFNINSSTGVKNASNTSSNASKTVSNPCIVIPAKCVNSLPDLSDCFTECVPIETLPPRPSPQPKEVSPVKTPKESPSVNTKVYSVNSALSSKVPASNVKRSSAINNICQEAICNDFKCKIRIAPKINVPITKPVYKCGQLVTSSCISLTAHHTRLGQPLPPLQTLLGMVLPPGVKGSKSWAKWHKEKEPVDHLANTELNDPVAISFPSNVSPLLETASSVLPSFVNQLAASTSACPSSPDSKTVGKSKVTPKVETPLVEVPPATNETQPSTSSGTKEESKDEFDSRIRKGWLLNTSARLRIADLYLMFGSNGRLEMDYSFEGDSEEEICTELPSLNKLLSLAKLWFSGVPLSTRECWACGHKPSNSSSNSNSSNSLLIEDPKVEVKTEVVETPSSTTAAVVVVSPAASTTGRFRQPLLPAPSSTKRLKSTDETYKSLQLKPKFSNRRGRYRPKNVVVQRMLPLLPKASSPAQSCTVVTLQVVAGGPTGAATGEFIKSTPMGIKEPPYLKPLAPKPVGIPSSSASDVKVGGVKTDCAEVSDGSKPFKFLNSPYVHEESVKPEIAPSPSNFSGLLGGSSDANDCDMLSTPPTSPGRILKEGESQWLNAEVSDFSLSSFLGHLESPLKANGILEDTRMSADVDSQLQSLMTESSLDYTAKFADLAAKIASPGNSNGTPTAPS